MVPCLLLMKAESVHELPCLVRSAKVRGAPLSPPGQEVGLANLLCVHALGISGSSIKKSLVVLFTSDYFSLAREMRSIISTFSISFHMSVYSDHANASVRLYP